MLPSSGKYASHPFSAASLKGELREYLHEKNLNELMVTIMEAVLTERPECPIKFMMNFLCDKYPDKINDDRLVRNEIDILRRKEKISSVELDTCPESLSENDCSSDEELEKSDTPVRPDKRRRSSLQSGRRRKSIFANPPNLVENYVTPKVVPKSEEVSERLRRVLQKNILFVHLDEHQISAVKDAMNLEVFSSGDVIIEQGKADGKNFYVIESGSVDVFISPPEGSAGERRCVKTCGEGEGFGELAIMYNAPRAATCIATAAVHLWVLDRDCYKRILMKTTIDKRNLYRMFLEKVSILSQCTQYEILTIADALEEEVFNDGDIICKEGQEGDRFYFIESGTVVCSKMSGDKDLEVAHMTSGSYFGEIALLSSKTRQATITSVSRVKTLSVERRTFNRVMGPLKVILQRNMELYKQFQATTV